MRYSCMFFLGIIKLQSLRKLHCIIQMFPHSVVRPRYNYLTQQFSVAVWTVPQIHMFSEQKSAFLGHSSSQTVVDFLILQVAYWNANVLPWQSELSEHISLPLCMLCRPAPHYLTESLASRLIGPPGRTLKLGRMNANANGCLFLVFISICNLCCLLFIYILVSSYLGLALKKKLYLGNWFMLNKSILIRTSKKLGHWDPNKHFLCA